MSWANQAGPTLAGGFGGRQGRPPEFLPLSGRSLGNSVVERSENVLGGFVREPRELPAAISPVVVRTVLGS